VPDLRSRILGCLLGGAVGDALGAPLEFMSLRAIRERFGPEGPAELEPAYGRRGAITDDTQMTLFTAEALIRAVNRGIERGVRSPSSMAHHSYLRWLLTQGTPLPAGAPAGIESGWLLGVRGLWHRRAPGSTCLAALASGRMGTIDGPVNGSKGCGGVMRVAPAAFACGVDTFRFGCEVAAITHGHPSGYLAAGVLAVVIRDVATGADLTDAIGAARNELPAWRGHEECLAAIDAAVSLAAGAAGTPGEVESLGAGWVAEEALAIGLFAALAARDLEHGVRLAVNHSGDSDSTGSIAGQLLGAAHGVEAIPRRWLDALELRDVISTVAEDLWSVAGRAPAAPDEPYDVDRYPAW